MRQAQATCVRRSSFPAARLGLKVALVQDRPVLGGNGSSEVRVWPEGYTQQQPYPRVGDVVSELVASKTAQSGNARAGNVYEDERKLALVRAEPNVSLFLEQRVNEVEARDGVVRSVTLQHVRTARRVALSARWFADCTGDGTVGFLAGADHEISREGQMGASNLWDLMDSADPEQELKCECKDKDALAISVPDGLVAPLVKDVNKKNVRQIARDSQALIERARNDKLDLSDLEGGCITISNLGAVGDRVTVSPWLPCEVRGLPLCRYCRQGDFSLCDSFTSGDIALELRHALEPWHVLGEEPAAGGTARYVDSSTERVQARVQGWVEERYVLACNGRAEGERDEHPAEARLDPEIDDERDGDMDVEVPAEGELPVILPQVTERPVDREGEENQPRKGEKSVHGTNSMVLRKFCQ